MQAAYGLFDSEGNPSDILKNEETADFTDTQATEFVARFDTMSHHPNDETGFSATLFRDTQDSNQAVLAIRGTEPSQVLGPDGEVDAEIVGLGLALNQVISLYNYVNSLREGTQRQIELKSSTGLLGIPPQGVNVLYSEPLGQYNETFYYIEEVAPVQGSGELADGETIVVGGHSLGGHLSAITSALFPELVSDVYTYNAPGFDPAVSRGLTYKAISYMTGNSVTGFNALIIHSLTGESNFGGDDADVISGLGTPFSTQENIFIEVNSGLTGHSKVQFTDSLKLYDVFSTMDASLTPSEIAALLHAGSHEAANSLEKVTTALAEFFNIADAQIPQYVDTDNILARNKYHEVITAIKTAIGNSQYGIELITGSAATLAAQDTEAGRAYRYSLVNLLPFVITGDFTGTTAEDSQYNLEDGDGNRLYSDKYLADRANMLETLLLRNTADTSSSESADTNLSDTYYRDVLTSNSFTVGDVVPADITDNTPRIFFSDDTIDHAAEGFVGGSGDDKLYGMGGNDNLNGAQGNDYLEGGLGDDTFEIDFNNASPTPEIDTVVDAQGNNTLKVQDQDTGSHINLRGIRGKTLKAITNNGKTHYAELGLSGNDYLKRAGHSGLEEKVNMACFSREHSVNLTQRKAA